MNFAVGSQTGRGAGKRLSQELIDQLLRTQPAVGAAFPSDHDLVRRTGLSRTTVRRVLKRLQQDGWIERRHGRGTYVGPRLVMGSPATGGSARDRRSLTRIAVVLRPLGDLQYDWYTPALIQGIESRAEELGLRVELLTQTDLQAFGRRLAASMPDALVVPEPDYPRFALMQEAQRLGIQCVRVGNQASDAAVPTVMQDDRHASHLCVRQLRQQGIQRIGLVLWALPAQWMLERRQGFVEAMEQSSAGHDERNVFWLPTDAGAWSADKLLDFVRRNRLQGLILAAAQPLRLLGSLVRSQRLGIPEDLSVVAMGQYPQAGEWLAGIKPAVAALPLQQMGRQVAEVVMDQREGKEAASPQPVPFDWMDGDSIRQP